MIQRAETRDIDDIMEFIDTYWQKGHILARSKEFFQYQHVYGNEVSYIISRDGEQKIDAVLGYIPYGKSNRDVMLALWKKGDSKDPFLGVELLQYLEEHCDVRMVSCAGINTDTFGIYRFLGYYVDKMKHYYRLNPDGDYQVAKITEVVRIENTDQEQYALVEFNTYQKFEAMFSYEKYMDGDPRPCKEKWYLKKRYYQHPVYQYRIFGIKGKEEEQVDAVLFSREVEVKGRKILRIMDFIGNQEKLAHICAALDQLIKEESYEYIDFYQWGIEDEIMHDAGFTLKTGDANIIPNYFEPFVQENIDINFCTQDKEHFVICKGDGDQDRPNRYIPR